MNNLDKQYQTLLQTILDYGIEKGDRTGTGTKSIFGYTIRHNMKEGFPLITTKKMPFRLIATELLWFLRGDTNIKFLVDNDCHIWDGDAYKNYLKNWKPQPIIETQSYLIEQEYVNDRPLPKDMFIHCIKTDDEFAKKWGELGPIYGAQWRAWGGYDKIPSGYNHGSVTHFKEVPKLDQIASLISDLKTNPDSRRLMVNAWNPGELDQMTLPPCHYGFQVYTRELSLKERMNLCKERWEDIDDGQPMLPSDIEYFMNNEWNIPTRAISLMWNQRSVDTFLGLPFNIASYGLLLEIIAKAVNMIPDELIGNLGDTHLYLNHIEQAKEQIGRELTHEERHEMLKVAMGPLRYQSAVDEQMPFGGGLSEYYESYKIPYYSREPYPLPTLNINTEFWPTESGEGPIDATAVFNGFSNEHFCKCLLEEDLQLGNYQSHAHIKAPLSN
jgi:thymidylate synthase